MDRCGVCGRNSSQIAISRDGNHDSVCTDCATLPKSDKQPVVRIPAKKKKRKSGFFAALEEEN